MIRTTLSFLTHLSASALFVGGIVAIAKCFGA